MKHTNDGNYLQLLAAESENRETPEAPDELMLPREPVMPDWAFHAFVEEEYPGFNVSSLPSGDLAFEMYLAFVLTGRRFPYRFFIPARYKPIDASKALKRLKVKGLLWEPEQIRSEDLL